MLARKNRTLTPSLSRLLLQDRQVEERYTQEDTHYLHVSSLFTACMRKIFLLWETGEREYRTIPAATQLKFDMGEAVEDKIRERLVHIGVIEPERPKFLNEEFGIVAHADGRLKNGKIIEIKGKDPAIFKMTKNYPLRRDQFQVELYLWCDQTKEGVILMFTWGEAHPPMRDLTVRYNLRAVEITKRTVAALREAESGGKLPPRVCASVEDRRAIFCPMKDQCFALESEYVSKTIEEQLKMKD